MLLVATPIIRATGGFESQGQPFLAVGGFVERTPQPCSFSAGTTLAASTASVEARGGVAMLATENAWAFESRGGVEQTAPVAIRTVGGFMEGFPLNVALTGGATLSLAPGVGILGGVVERTAVPVGYTAGLTEGLAPLVTVLAGMGIDVSVDAAVAEIFAGVVMNTASLATGLYDNFPMRSLFALKSGSKELLFGISPLGLHQIAPEQGDNGAAVRSQWVSNLSNLGEDLRKVVADAYFEIRCNGQMKVTIVYDEARAYSCTTDPDQGRQGMHFKRIKLPRGVDGTHVQILVENQDGADFDMQSIRLIYTPKTRRLR